MFALSTLVTLRRANLNADLGDPLDLGLAVDAGVVGACRRCGRGRRSRCPPVSSRTTSRSVPSIRSRRSGLASSSAGLGRTGRRFANSSSSLRRPSRPCSGRGASGSVESHFGPPTAASRTASDAAAGVEHLVRERGAVLVDRRAADEALVDLEVADRPRAAAARRP